jgi:hypothetical protein
VEAVDIGSRAPNPYLFIVGCARSGTTLLRRMVDAHPQIAIPPETHWIPRLFERRVALTDEGFVTPVLVSKLLGHKKFSRMRMSRPEVESLIGPDESVPYAHFVTRLFDLYGHRHQKAFVGDKTPGYVKRLPLLHGLWPGARFVHLIRDGRDVCLSAIQWRKSERKHRRYSSWNEDPVSTAALWWEWQVRLGRQAGAPLGPGLYHELRYEGLVARVEEELVDLCAFLALPWSDAMLHFHEGRTRRGSHLSSKERWMPPTRGLRDWRSQMDAEQLGRFEAVAGDLLEELGYRRGAPPSGSEALDGAARLRARFSRDVLSLGLRLPDRW